MTLDFDFMNSRGSSPSAAADDRAGNPLRAPARLSARNSIAAIGTAALFGWAGICLAAYLLVGLLSAGVGWAWALFT